SSACEVNTTPVCATSLSRTTSAPSPGNLTTTPSSTVNSAPCTPQPDPSSAAATSPAATGRSRTDVETAGGIGTSGVRMDIKALVGRWWHQVRKGVRVDSTAKARGLQVAIRHFVGLATGGEHTGARAALQGHRHFDLL